MWGACARDKAHEVHADVRERNALQQSRGVLGRVGARQYVGGMGPGWGCCMRRLAEVGRRQCEEEAACQGPSQTVIPLLLFIVVINLINKNDLYGGIDYNRIYRSKQRESSGLRYIDCRCIYEQSCMCTRCSKSN